MTRPTAPHIATPIVYEGTRYQQDASEFETKEFGAIYLAAIDIASGNLLWRLKITNPIQNAAGSPSGSSIRAINLSTLTMGQDGGELMIETEFGARYSVDLKERKVSCVFNPDDEASQQYKNSAVPPPPLVPIIRR